MVPSRSQATGTQPVQGLAIGDQQVVEVLSAHVRRIVSPNAEQRNRSQCEQLVLQLISFADIIVIMQS
jgi:hypothetical protein